MNKIIFCLCLALSPLWADSPLDYELPITDVERGLPTIAAGCVNVITGDYIEQHADIQLPGPVPLSYERFYSSADYLTRSLFCGWRHNHDSHIKVLGRGTESCHAFCTDLSGRSAHYKGDTKLHYQFNKHITNCGSGVISARTNLINSDLSFIDKQIEAKQPDGSRHTFDYYKKEIFEDTPEYKPGIIDQIIDALLDPRTEMFHYKISWNQLPNGLKVHYLYDENHQPKLVRSIDSLGNTISALRFHQNVINSERGTYHVNGNNGSSVVYEYASYNPRSWKEKRKGVEKRFHITKAIPSNGPPILYRYRDTEKGREEHIISRTLPDQRYRVIEYYDTGDYNKKDKRIDRVKCLKAPVGSTYHAETTHKFIYHLDKGCTDVYDALGYHTRYEYDKAYRLINVLKNLKGDRYVWDDESRLICHHVKNDKRPHASRQFIYDDCGNITVENLYGIITGKKEGKIELDENHLPFSSEVDCYSKNYTYFKDSHLLESESDVTGFKIKYTYYPGTDLIKSKFICDNDDIKIRYFFEYDPQFCTLCKTVKDDGITNDIDDLTGVTERTIETVTPRRKLPFGLPHIIEEKFLNLTTKQEELIKKTVIHYSPQGWVLEKEIYDSRNEKQYSLFWEYDAHGNVILERDALGRAVHRAYDQNNNLLEERWENYHKKYEYDFSNRCIAEKVNGTFVTSYTYDLRGNRTAVHDWNGNATKYQYDELGRVVQITYPDGTYETFAYDIFNAVILHQDQCGLITKKKNNILGQPLQIQHPDDSTETNFYTIKGKLAKNCLRNGHVVKYKYDLFGRLIKDENKTYNYNAFHLCSETDREGSTTYYEYDGAGRLIAEKREGRRTTYIYDTLGNQSEVREWLDETRYIAHLKEYDFLGQITKEITDGNTTTYAYDADGNCCSVKIGESLTKTEFDFKRPVRIEDAMGHVTHIEYRYGVMDDFGNSVAQVITTEPSGYQNIVTKNVLNHDAKVERRDPLGHLLSQKKMFYNGKGELLQTKEGLEREITNTWEYSRGHLVRMIEAAGSKEQRITTFKYNQAGEKITTIQPNGLRLHYSYDEKGRLSRLKSKDIDYTYKYNALDLPIEVIDAHGGKTQRKYDPFGKITEETLANSHRLFYEYDPLGRLTRFTLPDRSSVRYKYDFLYLRTIERYSPDGALLYTHVNEEYDAQGRLTKARLPGAAGAITYSYDALSRPVEIAHPLWEQKVHGYYLSGNLIGYNNQTFAYDGLNQLIAEEGHTYEYDSLHNRRMKDGKAYKLNDLNQIADYRYDLNGNLIDDGEATYSYDALNRLTKVTKGGKQYEYLYDPFNRRITKKGDTTLHYLYMEKCEIGSLDEHLRDLRLLRTPATEIGTTIAIEMDGRPYVPLQDINGHIVALLDFDGNKVEERTYTAFGEGSSPQKTPWGYAGKRRDQESGLIYFGNRFYVPHLGRFLNPDPAGYEDGSNLYAYARNNPLIYVDHFGLSSSGIGRLCAVFCSILFSEGGLAVSVNPENGQTHAAPFTGPYKLFGPPRDLSTVSKYYIKENEDGTGICMFQNGVRNNKREYQKNLEYLAQMSKGIPIVGIHQHTCDGEGLLDDFLRYFIYNISGTMSNASTELLTTWVDYVENNPGKRILMFCHSEGAVHVRNALRNCAPEISSQIDVVVIAGGAYIDKDLAGSVAHYCSSRDIVPYLDYFGRRRAIEQGTLHVLEPAFGASYMDHSFRSPTFEDSIELAFKRFRGY